MVKFSLLLLIMNSKLWAVGQVDRVRIPLTFTAPVRAKSSELVSKRYTLRAELAKKNHFFLDGWHLETEPLKVDPTGNALAMRLHIMRRWGQAGAVEEKLGTLELAGPLATEKGMYLFLGGVQQVFMNTLGEFMLKAEVGATRAVASRPPY
jgi:hypothetical protein